MEGKSVHFVTLLLTGCNDIIAFTLLLFLLCNMDATLLLKLLCCAVFQSADLSHETKCNFRELTMGYYSFSRAFWLPTRLKTMKQKKSHGSFLSCPSELSESSFKKVIL